MNYEELRQYLKQNPFCFRTVKEREEEMNNRIMKHEGKKINFSQTSDRYHTKEES